MPLILDSPPPSPALHTPSAAFIRRHEHHTSDVIIVGAGILGCALAITFARQGRSVTLLEKSLKQPDRIVGELLQPGGVEALEKLGIRECLEGIDAVIVKGYEIIYYGDGLEIKYPKRTSGILEGIRPEGRSFHHGRFISRLRETAMKEENISVVESTVTGTVKCGYTGHVLGVQCTTKARPDVYFADLTVVADGYASRFRKEYLSRAPVSRSKFWGLELIDAKLPHALHGHVILTEGAPVLLYQIGTHETRALVDVPEKVEKARLARGGVKGHLREVVLPSLPACVQPSFERALDEGRLRSMPNSFLPASVNQMPGIVMLGDAMNMRHPLTGGGMTVAFNDVVLLRELLSPEAVPDLGNTKLVRKQMRTFHWRRKRLTAVINILAQALYDLFAADDPQLRSLQNGCIRYFELGGACIDGPIGLLGGIIRRPLVLFYHFFSVALLAIWLLLCQAKLVGIPVAVWESFSIFAKACRVIMPVIWSEVWA
ncbi:Squalene epoxidase [Pseudocyphellaria aurata]|nr:Squalene epoxidase [Pseudocyphellaria aurata]